MIDTAVKLLKKIICKRLQVAMGEEDLLKRQYGFQKERSTVDALEAVVNSRLKVTRSSALSLIWISRTLSVRLTGALERNFLRYLFQLVRTISRTGC